MKKAEVIKVTAELSAIRAKAYEMCDMYEMYKFMQKKYTVLAELYAELQEADSLERAEELIAATDEIEAVIFDWDEA